MCVGGRGSPGRHWLGWIDSRGALCGGLDRGELGCDYLGCGGLVWRYLACLAWTLDRVDDGDLPLGHFIIINIISKMISLGR